MRAARPNPELYERDFYAWCTDQAAALRASRTDALDLAHLAEEVDALGITLKRELRSRLATILMHLLKLRFQPERATESWQATIRRERREIALLLEDSPSLRSILPERCAAAYKLARQDAAAETQLPLRTFPEQCPFALSEAIGTGDADEP